MEARMVDDWITLYEQAWRTAGTDQLSDIFTEDVSYTVSPFKKPIQGIEALKSFWEEGRDGPDEEFVMDHEIVVMEGDNVVVRVNVHYKDPKQDWKDLWIISFDGEGLCSAFEEWPFKPGQDDGHN